MSETSERTPTWRSAILAGAAALALLSAGLGVEPALAQQDADGVSLSQTEETLFRADEVVHHSDLGVTVLRGGVEIAQAGYVLTADTVSYNREADTLTASGDVVLMHPDGTVFFSTYTEITSDGFKNGVIENLRILLTDNARVAASGARRSDGNTTEMARAVYSPCDVCREDPTRAPLWQLKARRVTHDEQDYLLKYEDVWLEVAGVPVLYSPYFQHYDPRVQRETGFLLPSFGSTTGLGRYVQPRYFWAISTDKDLTVSPIAGTTGDAIMNAEYRQRFNRGFIEADFSLGELNAVTSSDPADKTAIAGEEELRPRSWRGHLRASGQYHIDETWRASLDLNRTTDKSYSRAYPLFGVGDTQLNSRAALEGFRGRNYASGDMLLIQSLRTAEPPGYREQDVLPRLRYAGVGAADRFGGRWQFDTEARFLSVESDDDMHRFTMTPGYGLSAVSPLGFKADALATVDANAYVIERDTTRMASGDKEFDLEGVALPKASLRLSYPFVQQNDAVRQTVSPILFGAIAPDIDAPDEIVFEDGTGSELDELEIFSHDRVYGDDAIDGGSRLAAGAQYGFDWNAGLSFDATLAKMLAEDSPDQLQERLGIGGENFDDWVGRFVLAHAAVGNVEYRFRNEGFSRRTLRRETIATSFGPGFFRLNGNYTFVADENNGPIVGDSEFYTVGFTGAVGGTGFSYGASVNHDITADATRSISGYLTWSNECTAISANFNRTFTEVNGRGRTLETVTVTLNLFTLGEYDFAFDDQ